MTEVTVSELMQLMKWKSRNSYYTYKKNGTLKNCYVPNSNNKKLYLEKVREATAKSKSRPTHLDNQEKQKSKGSSKKTLDSDVDTIENREELEDLLLDAQNSMQKVTITKDFWLGKINQQKFLKEDGELVSVDSVKAILDDIGIPLAKAMDDLPFAYASRFDMSDEAMEWMQAHINEIKMDFSNSDV